MATEADTRVSKIDPALIRAGWNVDDPTRVGREIPVNGFDPAQWAVLRTRLMREGSANIDLINLPPGISDYALYQENGEIIAVIEAKHSSVDPRNAQAQVEFYVDEIAKRQSFRPFAFLTNGTNTYFLDVGVAAKREIQGFFSLDDLKTRLYIRQNRKDLSSIPIRTSITDRTYQHEAIRRVCERFEQGKRRALIVMATGSGKTRVAMSICDVFLRANQARHILFVADRDPLVQQAMDDGFKVHLPSEPVKRIFTGDTTTSARLYVSTLQTLSVCHTEFTPGFFDLIIFDEVHRSIFNRWNDVLHYFDARVLGLTATPADFLDRNTFLEFECEDQTPAFFYSYADAVRDKYLVDFTLAAARTGFQRTGIRGVDLSEEERNTLIQRGFDPDNFDYSGTDLEVSVSNTDTLRQQWSEFWDKCIKDRSGQLPGKTIVFAITQQHAQRLQAVFDEMYPQFPDLTRVITYQSDHKSMTLTAFKKANKPRIAISVDLLDTGVDVPEVVNLVFMKPVQSRIKLDQMIGRGTRSNAACHFPELLPDGGKKEFLVLDFWHNDFNRSPDEERAQSLPVLVTLFNTRLKMLEVLLPQISLNAQLRGVYDQIIADVRAQVVCIPVDSWAVKQVWSQIQQAWEDAFWMYMTSSQIDFLRMKVGPLLRFVPEVDVAAATFTSKVERMKLLKLNSADVTAQAQSAAEDVSRIPPNLIDHDATLTALRQLCLSPELVNATFDDLTRVVTGLAGLMKYRRKRDDDFISIDLADRIAESGYILLRGGTEKVYVIEYRKRVEARVLALIDTHPTLQAIGRGDPVTDIQLLDLERTLRQELSLGDVELTEEHIHKAFGWKVGSLLEFLRRLLDLQGIPDYADIVRQEFMEYIAAHPFSADQIRFLRAVQSVFLQKHRLELVDLYEPPLALLGSAAVERWFTDEQVRELLMFAKRLET